MSPRKKIYISLVIFGILNFLLAAFVIPSFLKGIRENSQELLLEKKKIILLEKQRKNLQKLDEIYKTYQPEFKKIENLFIDAENLIEFVNFLEKNASDCNVQLKISNLVKKTEKEKPWQSFSLQLVVSGSFPNFLKFLEKLENGPYLIEIIDLNTKRLVGDEIKKEEFLIDTQNTLSIKIFAR